MDLLRARPTTLWALGIALVATAILPLSHLELDHGEDCPLCHLGSHSFEPAERALGITGESQTLQDRMQPGDFGVPDDRPHPRPPGRAPPFLRAD